MCGIYAEASWGADTVDRARVHQAAALLRRRGPDDEGFYFGPGVALAHRRLSIIDLASGRQPIENEDGTVVIVYNGEVYNFPQLRAELEGRGHHFRTQTDTEVILHLYEEAGERTPERLNGAFAFVVYDARRRRLFFCRDRLGIKPLYLRTLSGTLLLSSDPAPLAAAAPAEYDPAGLDDLLTYGYVPGERTVWRGITQLPPGSWGVHDDRGLRTGRYWDMPQETAWVPLKEWTEEFLALLADAVKIRLVSDVPLGAFLSGGVDSSTVVGMMRRFGAVRTFTIGFPEGTQDETAEARLVANRFGCRSIVERLDWPKEDDLIEAVSAMKEPFADPSMLPTFLVCRVASRDVKVVLSGDGADELFAGYPWFTHSVRQFRLPASLRRLLSVGGRWCERLLEPSPRGTSFLSRVCRYTRYGSGSLVTAFLSRRSVFAPELKDGLYTPAFLRLLEEREAPYLHRVARDVPGTAADLLALDFRYYLAGDILPKVDRMSMHHSLEVRVPFLDHRLVEHVLSLAPALRYRGGPKGIFKRAVKHLVPKHILGKRKQGFGLPIGYYFAGRFWDFMCDAVLSGAPMREGIVDRSSVERLLLEQRSGRADWSVQLWCLLAISLWWSLQKDQARGLGLRPFRRG